MEEFDSGLHENEKQKLKEALKGITLPGDLESKTLVALKQRGEFADRSLYKIVLAFSFAALIFTTGFFTGKVREQNVIANNNAVDNKEKYMLLLYEPAGFINSDTHFAEYGAWAQKLGITGNLSGGEALKNSGWNIMALGVKPVVMGINEAVPTGFFILNVSSESEALQIAKTCPHLKYKGIIQLRPIQN